MRKKTERGARAVDERRRVAAATLDAIDAVRRSPVFKVPGVQVWCAFRESIERRRGHGYDVSGDLRELARHTASRSFADRIAIRHAERRVEAAIGREHARVPDGKSVQKHVNEGPARMAAFGALERTTSSPVSVREWAARRVDIELDRYEGRDVSAQMRALARETAARPFADRIAIRHAEQRVESAVREHARGHER